ncbi:hypothetical protein NDU88_003608 [Pleurodeles waltl]|uniref:Uncharacterized protein n=1 Tax=Pleurodeles waltl TaxID=8319 RepID=A0AAV7TP05_PLEWA|nr:hypothetical protein NDU88_003608 [Pleurodeles waltl]
MSVAWSRQQQKRQRRQPQSLVSFHQHRCVARDDLVGLQREGQQAFFSLSDWSDSEEKEEEDLMDKGVLDVKDMRDHMSCTAHRNHPGAISDRATSALPSISQGEDPDSVVVDQVTVATVDPNPSLDGFEELVWDPSRTELTPTN